MAFSMVLDENDLDILVWIVKEKLVRKQEVEIAEYRLMRKSKALQEMRKQPCAICGRPSGTIDHITPLAKGGTNKMSNLRPLCLSCNSKKSDKEEL
jgi:5-methylcytosine-specific restriction endonuclease McrA